jgi:glucokinase
VARHSIATGRDSDPDDVIRRIGETARNMAPGPATIGVSLPGLVEAGALVVAANLERWTGLAASDRFAAACGRDVTVVADSAAAARAEADAGGHPRGLYLVVTLGTGVGTAVVGPGIVRAGGGGLFPVPDPDDAGRLTTLESVAGAPGIVGRARAAGLFDGSADASAELLARMAQEGDEAARAIWHAAGTAVGIGAAAAAHLLLLDGVILTGGMSQAGAALVDPARRALQQHLVPMLRGRCPLLVSRLGADAGLIGAALFGAAA